MTSKILLSSKLTVFLLVIAAVFLGRLKFKQYQQNKLIEAEKTKILSQIEVLEGKNREVSDSLKYFKSEGFKERVAREQLNLKKPDEQIYSFKENPNSSPSQAVDSTEKLSNPQKWLQYFTNH